MTLPYSRSYWVEAGRLLAGFYPGDKDPDEADQKLQALLDHGITTIFNLMEPDEVDHRGRPFAGYGGRFAGLARQRGVTVQCRRFPIVDQSVPSAALMSLILDELVAALDRHETVYVHCWGGRGRTGTVTGCYLRRTRRLPGSEALTVLAELTRHNPEAFWPAPEMACQRAFIQEWSDQP